ncbi:MAG: VOC family protein [Idiomarina sp.]
MPAAVSFITLTVASLERAVNFYRDGLGWQTEGIIGTDYENGAVAFFPLPHGQILALWPRASLLNDLQLSDDNAQRNTSTNLSIMLAHNVASCAEVDEFMQVAEAAGAAVIKRATKTAWGGYAGCFQDPDQHLWEVVWNPKFPL